MDIKKIARSLRIRLSGAEIAEFEKDFARLDEMSGIFADLPSDIPNIPENDGSFGGAALREDETNEGQTIGRDELLANAPELSEDKTMAAVPRTV
jgi:Asp-tRNA(Asn)/Glu-tRNA(Gln) amidotransferase C subunit